MKSRLVATGLRVPAGSDSFEVTIFFGSMRSGKVRNLAGTLRSSLLSACRLVLIDVTLLPSRIGDSANGDPGVGIGAMSMWLDPLVLGSAAWAAGRAGWTPGPPRGRGALPWIISVRIGDGM